MRCSPKQSFSFIVKGIYFQGCSRINHREFFQAEPHSQVLSVLQLNQLIACCVYEFTILLSVNLFSTSGSCLFCPVKSDHTSLQIY